MSKWNVVYVLYCSELVFIDTFPNNVLMLVVGLQEFVVIVKLEILNILQGSGGFNCMWNVKLYSNFSSIEIN